MSARGDDGEQQREQTGQAHGKGSGDLRPPQPACGASRDGRGRVRASSKLHPSRAVPGTMSRCRWQPSFSRLATAAPFILLAASAVLTAALAWQAFAAASSHRQLAQRVLHDYADLAATEFSRRTTAYVGNYGVVVVLRALAQTSSGQPGLPSREALQLAMPAESRRAIELVGPMFRFDVTRAEFRRGGCRISRRPCATRCRPLRRSRARAAR